MVIKAPPPSWGGGGGGVVLSHSFHSISFNVTRNSMVNTIRNGYLDIGIGIDIGMKEEEEQRRERINTIN